MKYYPESSQYLLSAGFVPKDSYNRPSLNYRYASYTLSGSRHEVIRPLYPETTLDSSQLPPEAWKTHGQDSDQLISLPG